MDSNILFKNNIYTMQFAIQTDLGGIFSVPVFNTPKYCDVPFELDNGLNYKFFPDQSQFYTTSGVRNENPKNPFWSNLLQIGHIMPTYTRGDFKVGNGFVQVTGAGIYSGYSTNVSYNTGTTATLCPKNYLTTVTLKGDCGTVFICSHVASSVADFSLMVTTVAFPYHLVTQDKCIGWGAAHLNSYRQESKTGKLILWRI